MIATHKDCGSSECGHRVPHQANDFCQDGKCRWSSECRCTPETHREQLAALMMTDEWCGMTDAKAIDAIMEIFGEEKEGV
ncbi:MAG: hypothetical protein ABFD82_23575 [Syntrophaceae bacterium]